ncbi:sulfurtransferase-like selenium metabolism protein YedF [Parendozoicomonas sp. Alg238-R29]|uniref:sulfurtransferase-like selenium metabolism protein YedF n=1 Tax=Parendozoicomonas sp. Alg238-R29 TaxID=2993446 RepID=UPI00248D6DEF|nr:sulfurtransferase-like selenium metabolism protein YedF [Parendozoicomonas sp. Alg238-R29]
MQDTQKPGHLLDARGCLCPQPLIKTRRLWKTLNTGETFRVLLDNEIAHANLLSFLNDQNAQPQTSRDDDDWVIDAVRSKGADNASKKEAEKSPAPQTAQVAALTPTESFQKAAPDYVVALKSDRMGQGDDDLGQILVKGYINTLLELDNKPKTIVLYNGGVKLATESSGADVSLKALENSGVDVIVCGACVDFFEIKDQLAAGRISNMYDIAEKLAAAGHVVYP